MSSELLAQMQAKLQSVTAAKDANAAKGKELDEKLKRAFKNPPKRPNVTIEQIDVEMAKQEHRRNTTSMSLNDEKAILRELQLLKERKTQVVEYAQFQETIDAMKRERQERFAKHKQLEEQVQELTLAMKKLTLAHALQVDVNALVTVEMDVPEDRMGAVVGKGYTHARKLEADCGVLLDIDSKSTRIKITSTPTNVRRAQDAIENITLATSVSIGLHPDTIKVLMAQKGKNVLDLEQRLGLKLDINKAEGILTTMAAPARAKQLERAIKELEEGKVEIQLPVEIVPKLIGKKGETINQLMEDTNCHIDIDKVTNAVRLRGSKESVCMAKTFIYNLIEDQSQRERAFCALEDHSVFTSRDFATFKFDFFVEFLMANKAHQLKILRTDASDAKITLHKDTKTIHVVGNKHQLQTMEEALRERLREFETHHWIYHVDDASVLSLIIGKKGQKIKQIEDEGKDAHVKVDIQGQYVCVLGDTASAIERAKTTILEIVDANQRAIHMTSQHLIAILLTNKRAKLNEIESTSGCKVHLPPAPSSQGGDAKPRSSDAAQVKITLTGTLDAIASAKTQLEQLDEAHHVRYWPLDADEVPTVIGTKGATISELESTSGARLKVLKDKDGMSELEMIGTTEQLASVQTSLDTLLQTQNRELLQLDPFATGCLIGKKGDRIKTIRMAHPDANIDAFPVRGQVRIKAANPEALRACVDDVLKILRETQVIESVKVPTTTSLANFTTILGANPALAMRLYELEAEGGENMKVTIQDEGKLARIRGPAMGIGTLKAFLEMVVAEDAHYVETIKLPTLAFGSVLLVKGTTDKLNENAARICKQTGCQVRVKKIAGKDTDGVVVIEGTNPTKVYDAKDQVEKVLQFYHSECIQVVDKLPETVIPRLYELLPILTAKHRVVFSLASKTSLRVFTDSKTTTRDVVTALKKEIEAWKKLHVDLPVPSWLIPALVGKNGETIKKLSAESNHAKLDLNVGSSSSTAGRVLTISARDDATLKLAVGKVKEFIQDHQTRTSTLDVARGKLDLVQSVKKETPAGIQVHTVPTDKEDTIQVVLYGGEHEAREAVIEKLEHLISTSVLETIVLPASSSNAVVGALIGKSGANIKALQKEFPRVAIDIKRGENVIQLRGPTDDVLQVKHVMEDKVQELVRNQEAYEQRNREFDEERRQRTGGQHHSKPTDEKEDKMAAAEDDGADENATPNTATTAAAARRMVPVGGSPSMGQPKLNKNQRRRLRQKAEKEQKSDVLSMIMGGGETTKPSTPDTTASDSSYYHSSSGYSLRL